MSDPFAKAPEGSTKKKEALAWRSKFLEIANEQNYKLKSDKEVAEELKKNGLSVLYVTWSDVGRSKNSSIGTNITDMQFFAMSPSHVRKDEEYKSLSPEHFVPFPAIRTPNFSDEVHIEKGGARGLELKVRDVNGRLRITTLDLFLKHIGKFIGDLGEETRWNDPVDCTVPLAVAHQFSILPLPPGSSSKGIGKKIDIGIAAFGYQVQNLHVIIGPNGEVGWAPEAIGYKRIFFRDEDENIRTISLEPEDRAHVKEAFFKEAPAGEKEERGEEEAKRYSEVENFIWHIQIEMELPAGHKPKDGEGISGWQHGITTYRYRSVEKDDGFSDRVYDSDEEGLQLARVKLGDDLGPAQEADMVPDGAKRKKGTAVRVTKMFYSVAEDGKMSFRKRDKNLMKGSLVTGEGDWHGGEVPIKLEPLPSDPDVLKHIIYQWPVKNCDSNGKISFQWPKGEGAKEAKDSKEAEKREASLRKVFGPDILKMGDGDEMELSEVGSGGIVARRRGNQLLFSRAAVQSE